MRVRHTGKRSLVKRLLCLVCTSLTFFNSFGVKHVWVATSSTDLKFTRLNDATKCNPSILLRYKRAELSSFDVSLNVSHLDPKFHSSLGWLSQEKEDRFLYEHFFHGFKEGTFVELGALDGLRFSNTYIYEHAFDWKGLLIEGETDNYVALERNRGQGPNAVTLHAAICSSDKILNLYGTGPEANSLLENTKRKKSWAPCLKMNDALKRSGINQIDFLSLDVEGAELETLSTMDFTRTPTFVILVEMRKVDEDTNPEIRKYLYEHGFCRFADGIGHSNEVWINPTYDRKGYVSSPEYNSPEPFMSCIDRERKRFVSQMERNPPRQPDETHLSKLSNQIRNELAGGTPYSKIVILVWFGRTRNANILKPYLLRETTAFGGVADEIWLSMSTSTEEDFDLGQNWATSYPEVVKLLCSKNSPMGCKAGRHDAEVWEKLVQPYANTLFVRVDDDIVYIERGAIAHLVAHKLFHKNQLFKLHGTATGNIVNHCQLPFLHEAMGAFKSPMSEVFGYYDASWTKSNLAYEQHMAFLQHYDAGTTYKYHYGTWDMNRCACQKGQPKLDVCASGWYRWCINFFVVGGQTLVNATVGIAPDKREESWISAYLPQKHGVHSESVGKALAVHFSYQQQRHSKFTPLEDLLPKYQQISSKVASKLIRQRR